MRVYLGTHRPNWLGLTDVPLFVSHGTLSTRRSFPRALGPWACDSRAFTEISTHGEFRTTPREYATAVRRYRDEIGNLEWAAIQDWMCEPWIIAKTGLSILEHQTRTIRSLLELRSIAPDLPWVPVIQGWLGADYMRHVNAYKRAGINLRDEPVVGIGSVCRRKGSKEAIDLLRLMTWLGLRLHGFGIALRGLTKVARYLASSDSMAWSYAARRNPGNCPGQRAHNNCANCLPFALRWHKRLTGALA